jgi:hypothetical protein
MPNPEQKFQRNRHTSYRPAHKTAYPRNHRQQEPSLALDLRKQTKFRP